MVSKRPFKFTTQEIAVVFWCISILIFIVNFYVTYQPSYGVFIIPLPFFFFIIISLFFTFLAFCFPCYQISKYNLNIFIDKMEDGWEGWLRHTKSRKFAPQVIKTGPLGQEKGLVNGHKADIINRGDFPITLQNGNHAVIKYDLMSHNINLNEAIGWKLIQRKWGFIGSNAFKRCSEEGKTIVKKSLFKKKEETKNT
jgi:predicted membrane protein